MIRPLDAADPPVIAATFAMIGWSKPREQYERYLAEQEAGERQVWVAWVDNEFAGYVTLNRRPAYPVFREHGIPEIQDLNVLPAFRRRGIGSALLEGAERAAGARVGIAVGLGADYGSAQRLYVRRGYVPDGRGVAYRGRTAGYGEQVVVDDDLVLCFTREGA
ncbi:MAG: Acetyltransferase [uncultured Gemmatimonadetes bacterium]|uniref:Acetyltransferase n=1 Tax=uncultured Gemmatimonadota bacterium TaxID=203437 RepID=A0A6J4M4G7_9BACT|nr:MAG: Acetyltransferase [uncultured Gemmatimonadota bacterium]